MLLVPTLLGVASCYVLAIRLGDHMFVLLGILFCNLCWLLQNWTAAGLVKRLKSLAGKRKLDDLTIGPVLTVR